MKSFQDSFLFVSAGNVENFKQTTAFVKKLNELIESRAWGISYCIFVLAVLQTAFLPILMKFLSKQAETGNLSYSNILPAVYS